MKSPRIYVTLTEETNNAIKAYALRNGISASQVVRECVEEQMKIKMGEDNIDTITKIIRQQIDIIFEKNIERIASITAKGTIMSATSAYLNAEVLARFLPVELQLDYQEAYDDARNKAIQYLKKEREG